MLKSTNSAESSSSRVSALAADARHDVQSLINATTDHKEQMFYRHVLDAFDFCRHAKIHERFLADDSSRGAIKYFELARYLKSQYRYVRKLTLDRGPNIRVLDIGCGPCHFGYICQYFGHEVVGLDFSDNDIFNELIRCFGVPRIDEAVRPATPLPDMPRFDLVTAFHATFFRRSEQILFTLAEWQFFFEDLIGNHMTKDGRIYLLLNKLTGAEGLHPDDREYIDFIEAHGGQVNGRHVTFDNVGLCPSVWLTPAKLLTTGDAQKIADGIRVLAQTGQTDAAAELAEQAQGILLDAGMSEVMANASAS